MSSNINPIGSIHDSLQPNRGPYFAIVYLSGGSVVAEDSSGATIASGINPVVVLQAALTAGYTVYIADNTTLTYTSGNKYVRIPTNGKLIGGKNVTISGFSVCCVSVNNVDIENLTLTGDPNDYDGNVYIYESSYINVRRVVVSAPGTSAEGAFMLEAAKSSSNTHDIMFEDCKVLNGGRHGWLFIGSGINGANMSNVRLTRCLAYRCGVDSRVNDYVVGYDISETPNIDNFVLTDCEANYNWESGFHMETPSGTITNTTFIRCKADHNGNQSNHAATYGHGFLLNGQCTLIDCIATNNDGASSGVGGCGIKFVQPISVTIRGGSVQSNYGYGIYLMPYASSKQVLIDGCHIGTPGVSRSGSSIGIYAGNPDTIIKACSISNSSIRGIAAYGDRQQIIGCKFYSCSDHGILLTNANQVVIGNIFNSDLINDISGYSATRAIICDNEMVGVGTNSVYLDSGSHYCNVHDNYSNKAMSIVGIANYLQSINSGGYTSGDVITTGQSLVDVKGLSLPIGPNEVWAFVTNLDINSSNIAGIEFGIRAPPGATIEWSQFATAGSATVFRGDRSTSLNTASSAVCTYVGNGIVRINGSVFNGATAGEIKIVFLKVASGIAKVYKGAHIFGFKVA